MSKNNKRIQRKDRSSSNSGTECTTSEQESHETTREKRISLSTKDLLNIGISTIALVISAVSLYSTKEISQTQLRAFVGPKDVSINLGTESKPTIPVPGETINGSISVLFENYGTTPALNAKCHLNWVFEPPGHSLPNGYDFKDLEQKLPLGLGFSRSEPVIYPHSQWRTAVPLIDQSEFIKAKRMEKTLFIYGHVDYKDIFRENHSSNFCFIYEPSDGKDKFVPFSQHNDAN